MFNPSIYDLSFQELISLLAKWGESEYRAQQIWQGLYRNYWNNSKEFTTLPAPLRQKLAGSFEFANLEPYATLESTDGETIKTQFRLRDGKAIEICINEI